MRDACETQFSVTAFFSGAPDALPYVMQAPVRIPPPPATDKRGRRVKAPSVPKLAACAGLLGGIAGAGMFYLGTMIGSLLV